MTNTTTFDVETLAARAAAGLRQAPHHDTLTCYTDYRCRRPECVDRYNERNKERLRARKAGTYNALVDATRARQHIRRLQQADMSAEAIACAAGISVHSVLDILRPHPTKRRARRRRITPGVEAKILSVRAGGHVSGRINSTGTVRRVQALVARGWPVSHIARRAGLSSQNAHDILNRPRVYVTTARAIAAVYDRLRTKRPEKHGVSKTHVVVARNRAARAGWPPPAYWDRQPGAIDDPEFVPEYSKTRLEIVAEDVRWLMASGLDRAAAARQLGKDKSYIDRALAAYPEAVAS
ncbi:hypothetical protein [Streptomyces sp. YIM S03343]